MTSACKYLNRTRQSYYKAMKQRSKVKLHKQGLSALIQPIRKVMPRLGGRKLLHMVQPRMRELKLKIGRDRFFEWLRENDLLIRPKRRYVTTTNSRHRFWVHKNLSNDLTLTAPNQLWVSDITYLRTQEGFCYLALITDAYSRKIVGYDVSDTLELDGCMRALRASIQTASDLSQLIHHSDRGIQYCSNTYVDELRKNGIKVSMAAKGNCYENALAERVNGILKNEFNLDTKFATKRLAKESVRQAVYIYNNYRPHWGLNLKTPQLCHK